MSNFQPLWNVVSALDYLSIRTWKLSNDEFWEFVILNFEKEEINTLKYRKDVLCFYCGFSFACLHCKVCEEVSWKLMCVPETFFPTDQLQSKKENDGPQATNEEKLSVTSSQPLLLGFLGVQTVCYPPEKSIMKMFHQ